MPVDGRPGYFKLVDLPDLFPVLPASAATLLRDVTVESPCSHGGLGGSHPGGLCSDEDPDPAGGIGTQRMHRLNAGHSDYKSMCKGVAGGSQSMLGLPG